MNPTDSSNSPFSGGPDFSRERALSEKGYRHIAGVDEAGRGPLAGPVVVAAVILNPQDVPAGLDDSKKLGAVRREHLFDRLVATTRFSIVSAPPDLILELNIRGATLWAMARAVASLWPAADMALIDGIDVPDNLNCASEAMVKGDGRSLSIAAASVLAKVSRDRMCTILHADSPGYGFAAHKGYGTQSHLEALEKLGASKHHRAGFSPVRAILSRS